MSYPDLNASTAHVERLYVEAGSEPPWARVMRDGVDVTDRPEVWTPEEGQRRSEWLERKAAYLSQ